jgi:hypothetical protein
MPKLALKKAIFAVLVVFIIFPPPISVALAQKG